MLLSGCLLLHFPNRWLALEFLSEGLLLGESKLSQVPVATYWIMDKYAELGPARVTAALLLLLLAFLKCPGHREQMGCPQTQKQHTSQVSQKPPGFVPRLFPVSYLTPFWPSQDEKMLSAVSLGPSLAVLLCDPSSIKKETSLHHLFQRLPPLHLSSLMIL